MSTATIKPQNSPEDLLTMPDGDRYELLDGKLVERATSRLSSYIAGVINGLLFLFCRTTKVGWVFSEGTSYQCFPGHPLKVRRPDVSFVRRPRLSAKRIAEEGHAADPPDLAVEVISPNDLYDDVESKVEEWLTAGVPLVWVVNPRTRRVTIRRMDGTSTILGEQDELTGEDIVPGFRCRVEELFLAGDDTINGPSKGESSRSTQ